MQEALQNVRQLHGEKKYDAALQCVWNAFGLPQMEQLRTACNPWPPAIVDIPSGPASEAWAEQLALQGVKCCNTKADNCSQSDWHLALLFCAAALQLCDGGPAWRGQWRSDAAWALARFQLLRRAAEALRSSGMWGKAKKAMDCLLQCEEILEISPHSVEGTEIFQFYTYLAETRRRLRDFFGARGSCRKALRITAFRPESRDSYATLFVLWVLQRAALEAGELEEAEDALLCAQHLTNGQKEPGTGADNFQAERCQRLLQHMDVQHRRKNLVSDRRRRQKQEIPHDVHWLLTQLAPSSNGINGIAMEFAQPMPNQARSPPSRIAKKVSFCLMAVTVSMPRRAFPMWKIAINTESNLKGVLQRWASVYLPWRHHKDALPTALRVTGGSQGPDLDLDKTLHQIRSSLPILDGRLVVEVSWPQEGPEEDSGPQASPGEAYGHCGPAGHLGRLRISSRYADVDYKTAAFHQSRTFEAKWDAGLYESTKGKYLQKAFQDAMRTPPMPDAADLEIVSHELFVFEENGHSSTKGSAGHFSVALRGPPSLIDRWEATCDSFQQWEESLQSNVGSATVPMPRSTRQVPFPVFIPTCGRPRKANLNWEANHVFGPLKPGSKVTAISPLFIVVVEPREEDAYRDVWPMALTLVLPENGRGPGYARWVVQMVCTNACEWLQKIDRRSKWYVRRLPFIWIADDGLSMFYRLLALGPEENNHLYISTRKGAQRLKKRVAPPGVPMFHEALLAVQRHAFFPKAAVSGFLRDDGTAVCKKLDWKADEMALYKIVLLNLPMLKRLGVEYMRDLQMYEDIGLVHQVILSGGRTLKCQAYCYRASHVRQGGCSDQRLKGHRQGVGTPLDDLMARSAFLQLNEQQQQVVEELHAWVRGQEHHNLIKKLKPLQQQQQGEARTPPKKTQKAKGRTDEEKRMRDYKAEYQRRKRHRLEQQPDQRAERRTKKRSSLTSDSNDRVAAPLTNASPNCNSGSSSGGGSGIGSTSGTSSAESHRSSGSSSSSSVDRQQSSWQHCTHKH